IHREKLKHPESYFQCSSKISSLIPALVPVQAHLKLIEQYYSTNSSKNKYKESQREP
ncbi:unnamed protein product, partial [Coccothraustes coccothraustes]